MKEYLTVCELGELIGRSPGAIRNLVMRRRVPFRKPAGRLVFIRSEIEAWIDQAEGKRLEEIKR